jgi:hypothetical protein
MARALIPKFNQDQPSTKEKFICQTNLAHRARMMMSAKPAVFGPAFLGVFFPVYICILRWKLTVSIVSYFVISLNCLPVLFLAAFAFISSSDHWFLPTLSCIFAFPSSFFFVFCFCFLFLFFVLLYILAQNNKETVYQHACSYCYFTTSSSSNCTKRMFDFPSCPG